MGAGDEEGSAEGAVNDAVGRNETSEVKTKLGKRKKVQTSQKLLLENTWESEVAEDWGSKVQ